MKGVEVGGQRLGAPVGEAGRFFTDFESGAGKGRVRNWGARRRSDEQDLFRKHFQSLSRGS